MEGSGRCVVLDTNVYISALFGGNPEEVYLAVLQGRFLLVTSPAILVELARTLGAKFAMPEPDITRYVRQIGAHADVVRPRKRLRVLSDDADNRILECAVEGKADVIVSGDRHLLALGEYQGLPVLRAIGFLRWLEGLEQD